MAGKPQELGRGASDSGLSPPAIARSLLHLFADPTDQVVLLGDMQEEFVKLAEGSPDHARLWYWRQTSFSLPHLLLARLRSEKFRRLSVALLAVTGAFLLTALWEIHVARNAARGFHALTNGDDYGPARMVFLGVQFLGFAVAGGFVARLTFHRGNDFLRNALTRLAPAIVVLLSPTLLGLFNGAPGYSSSFQIYWLLGTPPSFVFGTWVVSKISMRKR